MITSKDNTLIKHIKSLSQKKYRDEFKEYVVEGLKMSLEAIECAKISNILLCEELIDKNLSLIIDMAKKYDLLNKIEYTSVNVFNSISDTSTPQGVLVVCKQKGASDILDNVLFVLDDIQDPGNLGTIIRTLDSAGYKDLIISNQTADPYNNKVVRSTMGAIFRLNIIRIDDLISYLQDLKKEKYAIVISSLQESTSLYDLSFNKKMAIVIGNESKGVSKEVFNLADIKIKIPMLGQTESLNAAVATSLIAYEKVRQTLTNEK